MTDESVKHLLTEHLPAPPATMTEPPLTAIRRRARRRTGTQVALAGVVVAAIAGGTVVWANGDSTTAPAAPPTTTTTPSPEMLYPTYLPPGYATDPSSATETELRYLDPADHLTIPLVIRRLPADAEVPAEGRTLPTSPVRGHPAEVVPIENGGVTLTWIEDGSRFTVTFEAPRNTQIDFVYDVVVARLREVAEGLSSRR